MGRDIPVGNGDKEERVYTVKSKDLVWTIRKHDTN